MGWHVLHVADANNTAAVAKALDDAKGVHRRADHHRRAQHHRLRRAARRPDTREAHGEPLGDEEIKGAKRSYGWPEDAQFLVPDGVLRARFAEGMGARGAKARHEWMDLLTSVPRAVSRPGAPSWT